MTSRNFHDVHGRVDFVEEGGDPQLGVMRAQEIPDTFLQNLRDIEETQRVPGSEMRLAASIPAIFVSKWMHEGFNVYQEPLKAIEAKCRKEGLEAFLVAH
jgi:hypothetical protein